MIREFIAGKTKITYEPYLNFAQAVKSLGKNFSGAGEVFQARNLHSIPHPIWNTSGWTKEARFRAPNNPALLLRLSPLVENINLSQAAVFVNQSGSIFCQDQKDYYAKLKQAENEIKANTPVENRSVLILPHTKTFQITPTENFEVLRFYKGPEQAEKYLIKIQKNKNKKAISFYLDDQKYVDRKGNTYLEQARLNNFSAKYSIDAYHYDFNIPLKAFGEFPVNKAS
jgi:hypothetical protein